MQGTIHVNGRVAKIKVRVTVKALPASSEVVVTDVMMQPGGTASGWLPHVSELPWSAGITA